jgi:replicative DNA helicase
MTTPDTSHSHESLPPQAIEEEMAVLGSMMLDPAAIDKSIEILDKEDFYKKQHRLIFEAILSLSDKQEAVDYLTVTDQLEKMQVLEEVGGAYYVTQLPESLPSSASVEYYAKIVKDKSTLRKIRTVANEVYEATKEQGGLDCLEMAQEKFFSIGVGRNVSFRRVGEPFKELNQIIEERKKMPGMLLGLSTGYRQLNYYTEGFQKKDYIVIAGRPSMGKSSLAFNLAYNIASQKFISVGIISLEMSELQITNQLLAIECRMNARKIIKGELDADEQVRLDANKEFFSSLPITIADVAGLTDVGLRSLARNMKRRDEIEILFIDYIQLMGCAEKTNNDNQKMTRISNAIKATAKELDIPVVAISQLSRAVEHRGGSRPKLSDLRDSGSIEQDADVAMFIYRPEYYGIKTTEDGQSTEGLAEIIILKQRLGPIGSIGMHFDPTKTLFFEIDETHKEPTNGHIGNKDFAEELMKTEEPNLPF